MPLIGPRAQRVAGSLMSRFARAARSSFPRKLQKGFTDVHVAAYRRLGGRLVGRFGAAPMLVLTVRGRKSGKARTLPLIYVPGPSVALVASNGGSDKHPQWFLNLMSEPRATVTIGRRTYEAIARVATGEERARLWARAVELWVPYEDYQRRTTREIPVVVLDEASDVSARA